MQSKYENLPVYKAALDLTVYFENLVINFNRRHKFTLGSDLRNLSRRILILVAKANTKADRKECLEAAIEKLEELKILIHVCKEVKAFNSFNNFQFSVESTVKVLKQCEGWLRSQNLSDKTPERVR